MCCCGPQGNIYFLCGVSAICYGLTILSYPGLSKLVSIVMCALHILMIRGAATRNESLLRIGKVVAIVLMVITLLVMILIPFTMSIIAALLDELMAVNGVSYKKQLGSTVFFIAFVAGMEIAMACGLAWDYGKYYNIKVLLKSCQSPVQLPMVVKVAQPPCGVQMIGAPPPTHPPGYPVEIQKV